jgi:hypothetical protein
VYIFKKSKKETIEVKKGQEKVKGFTEDIKII